MVSQVPPRRAELFVRRSSPVDTSFKRTRLAPPTLQKSSETALVHGRDRRYSDALATVAILREFQKRLRTGDRDAAARYARANHASFKRLVEVASLATRLTRVYDSLVIKRLPRHERNKRTIARLRKLRNGLASTLRSRPAARDPRGTPWVYPEYRRRDPVLAEEPRLSPRRSLPRADTIRLSSFRAPSVDLSSRAARRSPSRRAIHVARAASPRPCLPGIFT